MKKKEQSMIKYRMKWLKQREMKIGKERFGMDWRGAERKGVDWQGVGILYGIQNLI